VKRVLEEEVDGLSKTTGQYSIGEKVTGQRSSLRSVNEGGSVASRIWPEGI